MATLEDWGCLENRLAPENTIIPISIEEPQVTLDVTGKKINFLVDIGATYSVFSSYAGPLSANIINL